MAETPPITLDRASRAAPPPSPATAYYHQRHAIAAASERLRRLREAIDDPVNFAPHQWAQWFAYAREYRPDLVLELGRGNGSSTAAVNEALHQLGHGRLVSLCLTRVWQERTASLLAPLVEADWFDRIEARVGDMLLEDFRDVVGSARRVLVVWDAHGFEVAGLVLGHLLPILAEREHFVIIHDVFDLRYHDKGLLNYRDREVWRGMEWAYRNGEPGLCLGWIFTIVDETLAVVDFLTRNQTELLSSDHSFHQEIGQNAERVGAMERLLSKDDWSLRGDWACFSLNTIPGPHNFPRFTRPRPSVAAPPPTPPAALRGELNELQGISSIRLARIIVRRVARAVLER